MLWDQVRVGAQAVAGTFDLDDDGVVQEPVKPKAMSPTDPAARFTGANGDRPFFAYSINYLVDLDNAIIVDVEATVLIRQVEVGAVRNMLTRAGDRFDLQPGHADRG